MSDVISQYQKWKEQGQSLRSQAKQAMESRFRDLLTEAVQIAEEYRSDFGAPLKPPSPVTAFRYKATARQKARKTAKKTADAPSTPAAQAAPKADPKVDRLRKRLTTAKKKLETAKADNKPP